MFIDNSENLHDINFFFQLRMRLQLLVSPQRMALNNLKLRKLPHQQWSNMKPAEEFNAADKSRLETVNETIKWFGTSQDGLEEVYKEKQKYTGHDCSVGILFSLFFSPNISMAQRVVHLVALTVLEVFPTEVLILWWYSWWFTWT